MNTNATCRWPAVADELKRRIAETPSGSDRTAALTLWEKLASGKEVV
jgi:hypothetical protein